ncbi:GvpL/GvpF family gas vesicle protein [Streptomyces pratensis]|uniref:GvpL/GvpF family gas vesicle protein n=1 Tax=Streptomyces pratensis TaxID=1169025 RepID=UPI00301B247A
MSTPTHRSPVGGAPADEEMTYVYAVGSDGPALDRSAARLSGVGGRPLRLVSADGLCALVSSVPAEAFSERGLTAQMEDLVQLEAIARAHHSVVDAAFAEATVLPMRLATVYLDDARAADMLARRHDAFEDLLNRLEGHVELGLKVYADPRAATAQAPAEQPDAAAGTDSCAGAGRAYLRQRRAQQHGGRAAYRAASDTAALAAELASRVAVSRAVHRPQQGQLASHPGVNVANEAYLVSRAHVGVLREQLPVLAEGSPGVTVEVTGPWAPYSFATEAALGPEGGEEP